MCPVYLGARQTGDLGDSFYAMIDNGKWKSVYFQNNKDYIGNGDDSGSFDCSKIIEMHRKLLESAGFENIPEEEAKKMFG